MSGTKHKGNGKVHVTETPDVSHIKNLDVTHEASDVSVGGVLKFVVGLTIFAVVVHVLMWGMFRLLSAQEDKEPPPGPMAMTEQERLPPVPRLQAARGFGVKLENGEWVDLENKEPEAEYRVLRSQWEQMLKEGLKDQSGKVVGMPIEAAMKKVLESGLPVRSPKTATSGGPADSSIAMPTAASSGRMTEKQ
jgi:hypothetical protein